MPRRHRTESLTSPRRVEAVERQRQALEMRMAGANFDQIAEQLHYKDRSGAYRAVMAALNRVPAIEAKQYRALNLERINKMRLHNWPSIKDRKAMDMELKFQERESRYLGLDEPDKMKVEGDFTFTLKLADDDDNP